ncbi:MAG: energy transducer TonB [Treponema sp.]|jgi:TonB family protein|nr:energy transducer TonB [Treponema sp.]
MNNKIIRPLIFAFTALLHVVIIFFLVFKTEIAFQEGGSKEARIMKVTDLAELPPPPPLEDPEIPDVEEIAEIMIETDIPPLQNIVGAGTLNLQSFDNYLQIHQVTTRPNFDERAILADIVYPPIARRSNIEGRVIIELFVDRTGVVQRVLILREEPEGRGFGEAAVRVFMGRQGTPSYANGEAVSCRYRYPLTFKLTN